MVRTSHAVKDVLMLSHDGFVVSKPFKIARISSLDTFSFIYLLNE